jgi:hypothetical protein
MRSFDIGRPDNPTLEWLAKEVRNDLSDEDKASYKEFLVSQFLGDFKPKIWPEDTRRKLARIRMNTWWRLFAKDAAEKRQAHQKQAGVANDSMQAIRLHQYPLGMSSRHQLLDFFRDIRKAIGTDSGPFSLILTGSSTTFYSENPDKQDGDKEHYFDKDPKNPGDYDVSLVFKDLTAFRTKFSHPPTVKFGEFWGASQTYTAFPALQEFYSKWANHPYVRIGDPSRKIFKRDVGIITLNYNWHDAGTACKWWKKDFVYDSVKDTVLEPVFGLIRAKGKGKGAKGKGAKGKGAKGKGKGGIVKRLR